MSKNILKFLSFVVLVNCGTIVFGQDLTSFEGRWLNVSSTTLAMQFWFSDSGSISATALVFSGNKCYIEAMNGPMGVSRTRTWEGTFKVNPSKQTLDLIDEFGDSEIYRYVFSETEDEYVLKLKYTDGEITSWYKSKN